MLFSAPYNRQINRILILPSSTCTALKIGRGKPRRSKGDNPYPTSSKALAPETRLMCLLEQAAGVLGRSSRLRMAPRDNHGWIPGVAAHTCRTALGGFGAAGQYARRGQV